MKRPICITSFLLYTVLAIPLAQADVDPAQFKVSSTGIRTDSFSLTGKNFGSGQLISWYDNYGRGKATIVLRSFDTSGFIKNPVDTILLESKATVSGMPMSIFDLQLSPDSSKIAFKYGYSDGDQSRYSLYYLDRKTKLVNKVSTDFSNYKTYSWSPDSQFIAFVIGGDFQANPSRYDKRLPTLFSFDTLRKKNTKIVVSNFLNDSFTWAGDHDLYYAVPSLSISKGKVDKSKNRPNLYRFVFETGSRSLLFPDCYRPSISPDGKKVAFFGSENLARAEHLPPKWQIQADYMTFSVADITGSGRKAITRYQGNYPRVVWSKDIKYVISIKQATPGPKATLVFNKWNVNTGKKTSSTKLIVNDTAESIRAGNSGHEPLDEPQVLPRFEFLGRIGRTDTFLINTLQFIGIDELRFKARSTLWSVDMNQGQVIDLAQAHKGDTFLPFSWASLQEK